MTAIEDMYIQDGEYLIPDGVIVKRVGNTLKVYKTVRKYLVEGKYRCRDCKHVIKGYTTNRSLETRVCELRPKYLAKDGRQLYYAIYNYGMPCDNFELRDK